MYHPVINLASAKSAWRGLGIYRAGKVLTCEKAEGNWFEGTVQGSRTTSDCPWTIRAAPRATARTRRTEQSSASTRSRFSSKPFPMPRGTFFERSNWKSFSTTRP